MEPHPRRPEQQASQSQLVELASGVDALYVSGRCRVADELLHELAELRRIGAEAKIALPFDLGALTFALAPHPWGKYRYCLDHQIGRIGLTESRRLPQLRIQPRAEFLHAVGPNEALDTFVHLLSDHCFDLALSLSRVDLYVDVEGWDLEAGDRRRFSCRADNLRMHEQGGVFSGFEFGSRRSKTICARVYDKTLDVSAKGTDWWFEVWGARHRRDANVTRVEFEIGRQGLKEFCVDSPTEVLEAASGIWNYCTESWLTHRCPTSDANRARWPVSAEWRTIQDARLSHPRVDLKRLRERARAGSLRKLLPGLTGYLVGFAVLVGTDGIEDTCSALVRQLKAEEAKLPKSFAERVAIRRLEPRAS